MTTAVRTTIATIVAADAMTRTAVAEDMHGIACRIDANTQLDAPVRVGQIIEAEIDENGRVERARNAKR